MSGIMSECMISVSALTKQYVRAQKPSLCGLDLCISKGDFFGLLGPNGSGKTTLISIMTGLIRPSSGKVTVAGKDIQTQISAIKPMTGFVPQEIALYTSLSLVDNLKFFGRLYGLSSKQLKNRISECLEIAHLTEVAKVPIMNYSGGMQRRANLVVGLVHNPSIIYLDEPTVNVDPQSREVIFSILKELNKLGATIIYTTHYLEEAEEMCNQVAIMTEGKVILKGPPGELIAQNPTARNLGDIFLQLTGYELRD